MIDKRQNTEQLADALLEAYAKELCRSQEAYLDALSVDDAVDPQLFAVPERQDTQGQPSLPEQGRRPGSRRRIVKRVLVLAAALVLIQGLIVISEGSKENTFNYFQQEEGGRTVLTYLGLGSGDELPAFALGYVPDGYRVIDQTVGDMSEETTYEGGDGAYLYFTVQKSDDYNASIDDEGMTREEISIRGYRGYMFYGSGRCVLMWQVGEYTLDLSGQLTREEAIKIAEGVVLKK